MSPEVGQISAFPVSVSVKELLKPFCNVLLTIIIPLRRNMIAVLINNV